MPKVNLPAILVLVKFGVFNNESKVKLQRIVSIVGIACYYRFMETVLRAFIRNISYLTDKR